RVHMRKLVESGPERVCWDFPEVRHNFSGTFLFLGDLFLKGRRKDVAKVMYRNAQLTPGYANWPYRGVLEERLKNLERNAKTFSDATLQNDLSIMPGTDFSCRACHQQAAEP